MSKSDWHFLCIVLAAPIVGLVIMAGTFVIWMIDAAKFDRGMNDNQRDH
jgi:hypothetical protein